MRFTWDQRKAASNLAKHGVSFEEGSTVFGDPLAVIVVDALHHERAIAIGMSARSRVLYVVHVETGATIRVISARRATSHERRGYEEAF